MNKVISKAMKSEEGRVSLPVFAGDSLSCWRKHVFQRRSSTVASFSARSCLSNCCSASCCSSASTSCKVKRLGQNMHCFLSLEAQNGRSKSTPLMDARQTRQVSGFALSDDQRELVDKNLGHLPLTQVYHYPSQMNAQTTPP